jgi:hypothetical protein
VPQEQLEQQVQQDHKVQQALQAPQDSLVLPAQQDHKDQQVPQVLLVLLDLKETDIPQPQAAL